MDRILPVEDAEISAFAKKSFTKQGMKIMEKATVKKLDRAKGKVTAGERDGTLAAIRGVPVLEDAAREADRAVRRRR